MIALAVLMSETAKLAMETNLDVEINSAFHKCKDVMAFQTAKIHQMNIVALYKIKQPLC